MRVCSTLHLAFWKSLLFLSIYWTGHLAAAQDTGSAAPWDNLWPWRVSYSDSETGFQRTKRFGPFWEKRETAQGEKRTLRPIWLDYQFHDNSSLQEARYVLYPLYSERIYREGHNWSVLNLARGSRVGPAENPAENQFTLFPLLFYKNVPDSPEQSYLGVFPLLGEIKGRLFHDRISWAAFPLYAQFEKRGHSHYALPWPFVRVMTGEEASGFAIWPLFGIYEELRQRYRYFLWPLIYDKEQFDQAGESQMHSWGVLPFFTGDDGPNFRSRSYLWPFFGFREKTGETPYHETLLFWPFLLQGRGEVDYENRWMPLYSSRLREGVHNRWILWPLWNRRQYALADLEVRRDRLLYFLWWDMKQESPDQENDFEARKTHLWPLFSRWTDGQGTTQWQVLSPLEPLFHKNQVVRDLYSPLFAIYRFEENEETETRRHRALFSLVTWERGPEKNHFDLGPLLRLHRKEDNREFSLGRGLFSRKTKNDKTHYRLFWLSFGK